MTPPITTVFFDLGDTLWHFPNMPPREFIRKETVRRLRELLATWGHHFEGERFYLGRDIRLAVEEETSRAFHGDCVDPNYPELCRRVAARHDLSLTREQGEELWEAWNLGGAFLGRELFAVPLVREDAVVGDEFLQRQVGGEARLAVTHDELRSRLRLGAVSPKLMQVYREEGLTLDQLMAFAITDDHARQQVFQILPVPFAWRGCGRDGDGRG